MPLPEAVSNRLIGELFVERGLVSQSQLLVALELQQETGQQLGQILVERFGVERGDLAKVVAEHWARLGEADEKASTRASESWRQLGEILVDRGFVTREQLVQALERQRQTGERLGEALIGQGVLSKFELAGSLAEQASTVGESTGEQSAPAPVLPLLRFERAAPDVDELPTAAEGEPEVETQMHEAPSRPDPLEALPERPAVSLVPEPAALEIAHDPAETSDADVAAREDEDDHAVAAYLAFASTPRGYRLVVIDDGAAPDVGELIQLEELGELVVLRRGVSPLPHDERPCVFLEPPVPAAS
jgi:hypothetical protein